MKDPYLTAHSDFLWEIPKEFNFGTDVVDQWATDPERLALIWCNEHGAEERFTFKAISQLSNRLANVFQNQGIGRGDRVIVMLPRIPAWQITMVALAKIGAVSVPCVPMLTKKDLAFRIANAGVTGVVTTVDNLEKFESVEYLNCQLSVGGNVGSWIDFDLAIESTNENYQTVQVAAEDPTIIYYTSGSTGHPKGVTHSSRALYSWRVSAKYWLSLEPDDLMFCTSDTGWSKAGTSILFGPWSQGSAVLFYEGPFDPEKRLDLIEKYEVTVFCTAATELRQLISLDFSKRDVSKLRLTVSAGESVNPEIYHRWKELTSNSLLEAYGLTETLMLIANYQGTLVKPGSMGRPLPGTEIAVLTEKNALAGINEVGQLGLALPNPQVMIGYWQDPQKTRNAIRSVDGVEYFLTGDNARQDEDGYFFYEGRADDVINSAGYRIGPQEVENALMEHPAVKEAAVVPSPDAERGEVVKAFIVLHNDAEASTELVKHIQNFSKQITAPYKYPRKIEFVENLPKSVTGKIQRRVLKSREFEKPNNSQKTKN
ncbi:MAG: AMP-binding protein [SAR324 cluster bacterium]|nr:AMP-binding protein [SAR324 cluster bacterium]